MKRRRSNGELARDRLRISELYLQGWIQADIAAEVGVSQQTVSRDLSFLHDEWRQSGLINIDEAKGRILAKIDHLERKAWEAYMRSCEDMEQITQREKRGTGKDAAPVREMTKTTRGQAGDPRYFGTVQWCIDRRCKILGVDAPEKRELTGKDGSPLMGADPNTIRIIIHENEADDTDGA